MTTQTPDAVRDHFSRRFNSFSTASRMNAATLFAPATASTRAIVSSESRTVVGFTPSGGRPMRRALSATALCVDTIEYPQPLIDGVSATAYISAIGYGGNLMSNKADAVREHTYVATDGILDNPAGFPIACRMSLQQHESRNASMERLASALNAASALIDKIEDTPSLFFGMEDTCEDEFATLRDALHALAQVQS